MEQLRIIENGFKRLAEESVCRFCSKIFLKRKGGEKVFCSPKCFYLSIQKRIEKQCAFCSKIIFRKPNQLLRSKHGYYFCDRICKEEAQRQGNIKEIMPFKGVSKSRWKSKSLRIRLKSAKCIGCKEKRKYLLQSHHIDGDKSNNNPTNIEIVCSNCHIVRHLKLINNIWTHSTKSLTPRDMIDKL